MNETIEKVKEFASKAHKNQVRKFTGENFINHPERVMKICSEYTSEIPILAAALLHDVLEDTPVTKTEIDHFLKQIMGVKEAEKTLKLVIALTDVFIKEDYPRLNRRTRKSKEAERMENIHKDAQTVKYADIIDNSLDIVKNEKGFAPKYLKEVKFLLTKMDKGNPDLFKRAEETVNKCLEEINKRT